MWLVYYLIIHLFAHLLTGSTVQTIDILSLKVLLMSHYTAEESLAIGL